MSAWTLGAALLIFTGRRQAFDVPRRAIGGTLKKQVWNLLGPAAARRGLPMRADSEVVCCRACGEGQAGDGEEPEPGGYEEYQR
ncbi:hypothetical protein GCM10023322_52480 [Rugosimonospora acidiphila]|uniref:Uncharacterized protein n=1 Tax=Rugosimonospora acidiphila TaxID=556531 RepID=A0ABP9S802_9ACTN